MSGVNDLRAEWDDTRASCGEEWLGRHQCANDLRDLSRTAWRPVSEPPTEADADENGLVLVRVPADDESPKAVMVWPWNDLAKSGKEETEADLRGIRWASIHKVVLMPEGSTE